MRFTHFFLLFFATLTLLSTSAWSTTANDNASPQPNDDLTDILAAEFSIQRNEYNEALSYYLEQAKQQNNAYLAERATQLALHEKQYLDMLEAALIWQKTAPDNPLAQFFTSLAYGYNRQPSLAFDAMYKVLQTGEETDFTRLVNLLPADNAAESAYLQSLLKAQPLFPQSYDVSLAIALIYNRQNLAKQTIEYAEKTLPFAAENPIALDIIIELFDRYQQFDKAIDAYQLALEQNPDDRMLRYKLVKYARHHNDFELAREQLNLLLEANPEDSFALLNLGYIALTENQLEEAKQLFTQLINNRKQTSAAHYMLAEIYHRQHNLDAALAELKLATNKRDIDRVTDKTIAIYTEQGRFAEAEALISKALANARQAERIEALGIFQAYLLQKQKKYQQAMELYSNLLKKNPDSYDVRYNRAMLSEETNNLALMESDLRFLLQQYPNSPLILNALGYSLASKSKRYNEAYDLLKKAQNLAPHDPAIMDSYGWVLFLLGKKNESLPLLQEAYKLFPDPEVAAHLGEVLWSKGNKEKSRQVFKEALQNSPANSILLEAIQRLKVDIQ